jgi:hypothetical protein
VKILTSVLFLLLLIGCDQGVAPAPELGTPAALYGISGMIDFQHWPPRDSIIDLRLVAFKTYPPQDILTEVLQGRARYTGTLTPYGADSIAYTLYLTPLPPGPLAYIVVAEQFGSNIQADWRVVGVYGDSTGPFSVTVPADSVLENVNLHVDFEHLPPQP